jgi:threonine/homoserine/homoserine lactone efflux protein
LLQFADPNKGSATLQLLTLGLTFALLTLMIFSVIAYFSGSVATGWGLIPA